MQLRELETRSFKGRFCPYTDRAIFCQEDSCPACEIYLDGLEDCIPWDLPPERTCYYCGHQGRDVNHVAHVYIGGEGYVEFPACDDKDACIERVWYPDV